MSKISQHKTPRQARGKKRMAELLRAAGQVFADVGYENAMTNAIAPRAGVSPGTLYQFFPNKQAIAEALANVYAAKNQALHESVFKLSAAEVPLRDLIDRLVGPFLEFYLQGTVLADTRTQSVQAKLLLALGFAAVGEFQCSHILRTEVLDGWPQ